MAAKTSVVTESGEVRRALVVGGGLGGLMTVLKLCEAGVPVDLFSLVPVKRSHSVCAQGGINASVNIKGEGDSPYTHFYETIKGGDFLANQPPAKGMAEAAPGIVYMLDRMGVPFNRTPEGNLDFRRFGGTLFHRTAFAGATTGQQLLYALDEQVRRWETQDVEDDRGVTLPGQKMVRKFEAWDLVALVLDEGGTCRGIVAQDLKNNSLQAFRGDAVCLATGGPGLVFGRSTNSMINTGSASAIAFQAGARYANGEFIQVHPTAIPGTDKLRLISESVRGEGGRIWVPKDKGDKREGARIPEAERYYFLEEKYPKYRNLVPRDIASRELFRAVKHEGYSAEGQEAVFLDVTHLNRDVVKKKLEGVLEIYEKFVGVDPYTNPMKIFPAVHYSMGGLWVDFEKGPDGALAPASARNQQTSIPGLFATGEADYQYHGANRLGANSLLSCIYGGMVTGPAMVAWRDGERRSALDLPSSLFEAETRRQQDAWDALGKRTGGEYTVNPYELHGRLGDMMLLKCTVERHDKDLDEVLATLQTMKAEFKRCALLDPAGSGTMNQPRVFLRHLAGMLTLAEVIALGARARQECRGAHYKPALDPELTTGAVGRDDKDWLKTTLATHSKDGPALSYEPVDISLLALARRDYGKVSTGKG
ncbi:MAG: succinate dehydrogenase flavoprotein subunit [Deltaproteobacteria bacterium]|nr:succinate dehydrogenase flavoprotein subunit [Deltaproteobacteria bacterium]